MTEPQKKTVTDLAPNEYQISERKDEQQIINELTGNEYLQEFVYQFEVYDKKEGRNKKVTNLSYTGIKEAVRERGHFKIEDYKVEETQDTFFATVKIHDKIADVDALGTSEAKKDQPFARVLALNKAERNAYAKLLPAKLFAEMIKRRLGGETVKEMVQHVRNEPKLSDVQLPFKARLMNAIRPDIANIIEVVHEDENILVLKPTQRLELNDFKETCGIIENQFAGKWIKEEGLWEIPVKA